MMPGNQNNGATASDQTRDPFARDLFSREVVGGSHPVSPPAELSAALFSSEPFVSEVLNQIEFLAQPASASKPPRPADKINGAPSRTRMWQARLPRVTREQMRVSAAMAALPAAFCSQTLATLKSVLQLYTRTAAHEIEVAVQSLSEIVLPLSGVEADSAPRVYALLTVAPDEAPVTIVLDAEFAITLVDRVLGGAGDGPESLRNLSALECAVVEFLCLQFLHQLVGEMDGMICRLERISLARPTWLIAVGDPGSDRCLSTTLTVKVRDKYGLIRVLTPPATLRVWQSVTAPYGAAINPEKIARYAQCLPTVRASLCLGATGVPAAEIARLEGGDVVIVAQPAVRWQRQQLSGSLRVRIGEGQHFILSGTIENAGTIGLRVRSIDSFPFPTLSEEQTMHNSEFALAPDTEQDVQTDEAANNSPMVEVAIESLAGLGAAIDGMVVTLHVELATRQLRLDELASLRAGQLIDLGCQATDPVELLVDGRCIARGQLLDCEGRLGVRITEVTL